MRAPGRIAFSPDGKTLACATLGPALCYDVRLIDIGRKRNVGILKGHTDTVLCLAFSQDGKTLATGSMDCTIKMWDVGGRADR
jgi:WD40 repeat protein